MTVQQTTVAGTSDRLSFLWLAVAAILILFTNGRWIIPIAPWLFAVFMIRFLRTQPRVRGLLIALLVVVLEFFWIWNGLIPFPGVLYFLYTGMMGLFCFLPFAVDRLISPQIKGILATLVFPLAFTTQELLASLMTPGATWGSIAYTQYGHLALAQIVSIAGLGGLTFLVAWFAAVVNWVWERGFVWQDVRKGVGLYAGIMAAVLLYGGARISLFEPESRTVRVASVNSAAGFRITDPITRGLKDQDVTSELMLEERDRLFERSMQAVHAGAKIVFWQESGCRVFEKDESAYVERGRDFARREQIFLGMAMASIPAGYPKELFKNKIIWIDPSGEIVAEYKKSRPAPGEGSVPGGGEIPLIVTPYGRIATSICFDMDFDHLINQAGKSDADLMIAPSNDWEEITPLHTHMAVFRAIENGFSMIRGTGHGLSMAVDYHGRELARLNWFYSDDLVMIADVPTQGVTTVFAHVGRLFSWLSIAVLIAMILWVVFRRGGENRA